MVESTFGKPVQAVVTDYLRSYMKAFPTAKYTKEAENLSREELVEALVGEAQLRYRIQNKCDQIEALYDKLIGGLVQIRRKYEG